MRQSSYSIGATQKDIRALAGDHYVNINIKATKTDLTSSLVNGILEAGTLITADGKVATTTGGTPATTNAYGVLFVDVDFNNSMGTEILPVCIHGFLKESAVKFSADAVTNGKVAEKAALNMIKFL